MSRYDFNAPRLFVDHDLGAGELVTCDASRSNYLRNVLRLNAGDGILVFNGRDGEWRAEVEASAKKSTSLKVVSRTRPQQSGPDIDFLFAPLKHARLDYLAQKVTEMGVARLRPVLTKRTIARRINLERLRANAIEAAEQCGILSLPQVQALESLESVLAAWDRTRALIFCDEASDIAEPLPALARLAGSPLAVLIGPEGGFEASERELLASRPFVTRISLGPRVLRADTAAVAALALVNAVSGDWR